VAELVEPGVLQPAEMKSQVPAVQVAELAGVGHPVKMVQGIPLRPLQAKATQVEMVEIQVVAAVVPAPLVLTELQALGLLEVQVQFRLSLVLVSHMRVVEVAAALVGEEPAVLAAAH